MSSFKVVQLRHTKLRTENTKIMSIKSIIAVTPAASKEGEEEDIGALIYRESQLRKVVEATAAMAAASSRQTSTRKRSAANITATLVKKKYRYECTADGCTNRSYTGGVCKRHGAKVKIKLCSSEGCTNHALKGGVCMKHGAMVKRCSSKGCTKNAQRGGVCVRHGAKVEYKRCSSENCTNHVVKGGVCVRHGAKVKLCSNVGCTSFAKRGGVCRRHGANRSTQDESTAFGGSEFELTTTTLTISHHRASRAPIRGQEAM